MKFNFKKIVSVLTSTVMLSSTLALAAAANYPAPFVQNGNADVAIVYGSNAATTDLVAVSDINAHLQTKLAEQTATGGSSSTSVSVTGEAAALFTGGTKIYINDSLNTVKSSLTDTDLPTILKDGSFSGNVDATYTQGLILGTNPVVGFSRMPTSSDDPDFGLTLSTSTNSPVYNATVSFNRAVNFTHADSKGQDITIFGQKFTVASATSDTDLVLLKSAEKISLSTDTPSIEVTVAGSKYTVELVSASDSSATVKVTDENGNSDTKEVSENASKKIQGLTVAVTNADETNLKVSASIIAGAEKFTLTSGSSITKGDNNDAIDGTKVAFTGSPDDLTKIEISIAASSSDADAIKPGQALLDPVFGTLKLDFASLSAPLNASSREDYKVRNSGDDKLEVSLTDNKGNEKTIQYVKNTTGGAQLQGDNDGRNITVFERGITYRNEFMVVGNEDEAHFLKVSQITNQTTGYSNDKVRFTDVFSGDTYEATLTAEGTGTVTIGGKVYDLGYSGASDASEDTRFVRLNHPDSSGAGAAVIYPTMETKKGARVAFYEPTNISIANWDGSSNALTTLRFPDGDGYTDVTFSLYGGSTGNFSINGGATNLSATAPFVTTTIGKLTYNVSWAGQNQTIIYLQDPSSNTVINAPALVIFEEKDDDSNYQALIVTTEAGGSSDDGLGVGDVIRTWLPSTSTGTSTLRDTLASNSKIIKASDLYGSVVTLDDTDSDQRIATISYPDEQAYALIYAAANAAEIDAGSVTTSGGSVKALGSVIVSDNEVSSVSGKNLIVVGGSCVNKVAAKLLGSDTPLCGAAWEDQTGVGAGSFLIQSFTSPYATTKVATLVAGYNAPDTSKAAKALTTQSVDTTVGKKYTGSVETAITLSTTQSA